MTHSERLPSRAAIYCRLSADRTGQGLGVARQEEDCRQLAERLGWTVVGPAYVDNDVSASTGRTRPAYLRLLNDLRAGVIDGVLVWAADRLHRQPAELEEFIQVADGRGVPLATVAGELDLSTAQGRMVARLLGAVARHEVEHKSARQRRANRQRAEQGAPPGGPPVFGYTESGTEIEPSEAEELRRAADTLLAGGSVRGVATDWNVRGIRTVSGSPWTPTTVRRMMLRPRYAGMRVYQGEVVGQGAWPAILDSGDHAELVALLTDPTRRNAGPPRRHLLSGVALCSVCGQRLYGVSEKKKGCLYRCQSRAHVQRRVEPIDDFVVTAVLTRLNRSDARDLVAPAGEEGEVDRLRFEETELRQRLRSLSEAFADGDIDRSQLRAGSERLRKRLEEITDHLSTLASSRVLETLVGAGDVHRTWDRLSLEQRREVISNLAAITVSPAGRGMRPFDPSHVKITWLT